MRGERGDFVSESAPFPQRLLFLPLERSKTIPVLTLLPCICFYITGREGELAGILRRKGALGLVGAGDGSWVLAFGRMLELLRFQNNVLCP